MSAKLGKCNKATYMDFENNIFEISENYSFSISKLYKEEEQIFLLELRKLYCNYPLATFTDAYRLAATTP